MIRVAIIMPLSSKRMINNGIWATGLLMVLLFPFFIDPERVTVISCLFRDSTGFSCPTCGLSHSFYAISRLHFLESFRYHWMGLILYTTSLCIFFKFTTEMLIRKEIRLNMKPIITKISLIGFSFIWIGFCIYRFIGEV